MPTILIVDDDPTIRAMFSRALQSLGDIERAAGGAEALRMLAARKYDVLLLDLHMPVVDGLAVLRALASQPGPNHDSPVFVITAETSDHVRVKALRSHAVFVLTKPIPIATLLSLVDASLKKSAARASSASSRPPPRRTPAPPPLGPPRASEQPPASAPPSSELRQGRAAGGATLPPLPRAGVKGRGSP